MTSDPSTRTPGQAFAAAYAERGTQAKVEFDTTITDAFPGFKRRPRIAMRALFKIVTTRHGEVTTWYERHPAAGTQQVRDEALRPESGFEFQHEALALRPTRAWVQVPRPLLDDPAGLATFLDFRLLQRLGTAENQAMALGAGPGGDRGGDQMRGLLETPGIRRLPAGADPISSLMFACDHVELMGGSADGIVMSTTDYYRYLFPRQDVLSGLASLGIRIVRTRMIAAGTAIVGDFYAGATIFDSGRSSIRSIAHPMACSRATGSRCAARSTPRSPSTCRPTSSSRRWCEATEAAMAAAMTALLSINGWCRNGSTLLGNLLNEVDGFFHVGELSFLWKNAYGGGSNTRCGCGAELVRCPIWSRVLAAELPAGESAERHAEDVCRRQAASARTRHTWQVLRGEPGAGGRSGGGRHDADRRAHAETLARTYRAIAEVTGCRVIVDSSKLPGEAALLADVEGVDPRYLHLVRDPRATAHSWMRQKDYAQPMSALRSTAYWVGFNLATHALARRHADRARELRYEDFVRDPDIALRRLIAWCGGDPAGSPIRGHIAELGVNHTVTGNPDRFRTGPTLIRGDDSRPPDIGRASPTRT